MDSVWTITMQIKKVVNLDFEKWRLRKISVSHKKKIASLHVDHGQDAPITTLMPLQSLNFANSRILARLSFLRVITDES